MEGTSPPNSLVALRGINNMCNPKCPLYSNQNESLRCAFKIYSNKNNIHAQ
jgi:hypothetical protein